MTKFTMYVTLFMISLLKGTAGRYLSLIYCTRNVLTFDFPNSIFGLKGVMHGNISASFDRPLHLSLIVLRPIKSYEQSSGFPRF